MSEPAIEGYLPALAAYLGGGGEPALTRAYEIGRRAIIDGLGVLDVTAVHHHAVRTLQQASTPSAARADAMHAFLAEVLAPFEMAFRGYREANSRLRQLHEALAHQRAELEASNRELESFSYAVAHDLRAPLRGIAGFSSMLLETFADRMDASARRLLLRIQDSGLEMSRLIEALLELSRLALCELVRQRFDISGAARRDLDELRSMTPGRAVDVVIADGLIAAADPTLLRAALHDLIANAWKFTAKRERARIEIGRIPGEPHGFFVRDDGAGFDMKHAERLFEPFQRLHRAADFEGTGLGLATVSRIVARHGGRIWAHAEAGLGATFYFTIPGAVDDD